MPGKNGNLTATSNERMLLIPPTPSAPKPPNVFPPRSDFTSLSVKDLLETRDAYLVHFSTMPHVVGAAKVYGRPTFLRPMTLEEMVASGKFGVPGRTAATANRQPARAEQAPRAAPRASQKTSKKANQSRK